MGTYFISRASNRIGRLRDCTNLDTCKNSHRQSQFYRTEHKLQSRTNIVPTDLIRYSARLQYTSNEPKSVRTPEIIFREFFNKKFLPTVIPRFQAGWVSIFLFHSRNIRPRCELNDQRTFLRSTRKRYSHETKFLEETRTRDLDIRRGDLSDRSEKSLNYSE